MTQESDGQAKGALSLPLESLNSRFAAEIREIDRELVEYLRRFEEPGAHYRMIQYHFGYADEKLNDLLEDEFLPRGKRLRPILCLLFCRMMDLPGDIARTIMMVTEVMHSASLAHDDIQDHDLTRWGRPTVNRLFGMEQAINVGDAMIGMVYQLLLELRSKLEPDVLLDVIDIFNDAHIRMCEGQHLDLTYKFYGEVGVAEYLDMVSRKTAAPCVCIAEVISALASSPKQTRETLSRFGQSLGMLYQICDDIRGIWCEPDALGRQVGHDVCQQRASLPLLYAFQRGSSQFRKFLKEKVAGRDTLSRDELEYVQSELNACGAYDLCHRDASHHYQRAVDALRDLPMSGPEIPVLLLILSSCYASVNFAGREPPSALTD